MKIVYVYDCIARIGGVERILAEKMSYLADLLGYEVFLITTIQGKHPFSFPISSKVRHIDLEVPFHHQYRYKYPLRLWKKWMLDRSFERKLNKVIKQINPDIIIGITYFKGDVICRINHNSRKIIESHNTRSSTGINDGYERNKIIQWFYLNSRKTSQKIIENKCDVLVALTNGDAQEWKTAKNVRVIPNITTQQHQYNTEARKIGTHAISVGRLSYQKGFDRLINAWEIVKKKYPDWRVDVYGDEGELKQQLEEQVLELNLSGEITIHPPTNKIMEKYQEYDFYVMSSRYEGWGLVLVEAMSCGIPCIAFDCPYGPSDIIEHGKNGLLVKNGDIQGLADAICWMIEHEEERKQMGLTAKETSKKYTPEVIMRQWDNLFKEII